MLREEQKERVIADCRALTGGATVTPSVLRWLGYASLAIFGIGLCASVRADVINCNGEPSCEWRVFARSFNDESDVIIGNFLKNVDGSIVFADPSKVHTESKDASLAVTNFKATGDPSMSFDFSAKTGEDGALYFFQFLVPIMPIVWPDQVASVTLTLDYSLTADGDDGAELGSIFIPPLIDFRNWTDFDSTGQFLSSIEAEAGGPCSTPNRGTVHCGHIVTTVPALKVCDVIPNVDGCAPGGFATWQKMSLGGQFTLSPGASVVGTVFVNEISRVVPEPSSFALAISGLGLCVVFLGRARCRVDRVVECARPIRG